MLTISNLSVAYGNAAPVLESLDFSVPTEGTTALLGSNGAGKTTLMRALSSTLRFHGGRILSGTITFEGSPLQSKPAAAIVRSGLVQSPEGRHVFATLTVDENLTAGATTASSRRVRDEAREHAYSIFPRLAERRAQHAATLSGGEQQMLAIARALMSGPRMLLLDEPSLGLAPKLVHQVGEIVRTVAERGIGVLLVEQNAAMALSVADRAAVLDGGRIVADGSAAELEDSSRVRDLYLGGAHQYELTIDSAANQKHLTKWAHR
ncbi:High-affinity branched-chain amino acid transport ATP-binding protein LivF [Rhodococcus sp. T7]|nr:High-affinity branched-chain amino acid transport ATP-binding protein LivF [Rhodococcus sp. T7]